MSVHRPRPSAVLIAALALAALALGGCGSSKPKPAELPRLTGNTPGKVVWSTRIGKAGVGFRPVYAADSVWVASANGEIVRIEAASGKRLWSVSAGKPLVAGVGSDGQLAVVASRDGNLIAFDADGKQKWATPVGSEVVTVPAVGEGVVIVRASDNRVSAFDADTGRRRWTFTRQNPTLVLRQTGQPVIAGGAAYFGPPGGRLAALRLTNGALRWEIAVSQPKGSNEIERISDVVGTPVLNGRDVCAASFQGRVACADAGSGRALWARDLSSSRGLDTDSRSVVAVDVTDQVQAYSRAGASLWRNDDYKLRGLSMPLVRGSRVLVGDDAGLVHLLSLDDGSTQGRLSTDGSEVLSGPVDAGPVAVVQTARGGVYAIATD